MDLGEAGELAANAIDHSVLRVSLLPRLIWSSDGSAGMDISGLGASGGQLSPYRVPRMEEVDTDSMHLVRKRIEVLPDQNRPTLDGKDIDLAGHAADIVRGFEEVYRLLLNNRDELLAPDGPLARFADDEVRVILRPTTTYNILLYEGYHPDVLRDALDRDRLLDRLRVGIADNPYLARVIPFEQADLREGDIPFFTTRPGSRDLWTSDGERLPDFFTASGMELVERRLRGFGAEDLERQRWIIRASLATTAKGGALPSFAVTSPHAPADRERLLSAARAVGDRLAVLALREGGCASWLGLQLGDEDRWSLAPLGADLYNGLPGVVVFLAYLGHLTGEGPYSALARSATATLLQQAEQGHLQTIGGFDGWGGLVYVLAHLGALWDRPDLLARAEKVVAHLPPLIQQDEHLDIISGAAGCLGGLLSLQQAAPSGMVLSAAVQCGDRLLALAQPMAQGLAWPPSVPARAPLTGFSHGAAGMAWALLELSARTGEGRFRHAALDALAYERSLFSPRDGNWPDFRLEEGAPATAPDGPAGSFLAWCHGAPGIGLARLEALRHLDDPTLRAEVEVAARTTLAGGFGNNHTLCHGDLGNLELLAEAGRILEGTRWHEETDRLAGAILDSIERDGWLCAAPRGVESPGLMTGLAGIGLGLLRLADPERVPSVLVFAPPT